MAVGLKSLPLMYPVAGVRLGTAKAGLRTDNRRDLLVMELAEGSSVAAVFTRNAFCAAPVVVARRHLQQASPRALVVNSGNANAGTGIRGIEDARRTCELLAELVHCSPQQVLPFSTGVIGERLPMDRVEAGLSRAVDELSSAGWEEAARAIMTTDTVPKGSSWVTMVGDATVVASGIAKGAGMIHPNMATMLAFIAIDAAVPRELLQRCLQRAVSKSFNRITVDGDTSTNDACVLIATGQGKVRIEAEDTPEYEVLVEQVEDGCLVLAQAIIRDAEGATKFITVQVEGARGDAEALRVAYLIAGSPLVKTAFFASDPNWGRILAVVGRAPLPELDITGVEIYLDEVRIVSHGAVDPKYTEAQGKEVMARDEVTVRVNLNRGRHRTRIWTSDLSYDYVRINAEYRT